MSIWTAFWLTYLFLGITLLYAKWDGAFVPQITAWALYATALLFALVLWLSRNGG